MSRIGKVPIDLPKEVKVNIEKSAIKVEGPKGKLELNIPEGINVEHKDNQLIITRISDIKQNRANHGTIRARLSNIVKGVTVGHKKEVELQGLGYRAQMEGKKIIFNIGLSHQVEFPLPEDVNVSLSGQNVISVEGSDNVRVGQVAATIRGLKPVEPYKGKGFRYVGENVRRKQGKSVTK